MNAQVSHDQVLKHLLETLRKHPEDRLTALATADRLSELGEEEESEKYRLRPEEMVLVGPDDLGSAVWNYPYKKVVYYYQVDGYEGSGCAVCLRRDGLFDYITFSHCSCNDPIDDWDQPDEQGIDRFRLITLAGNRYDLHSDDPLWLCLDAFGIGVKE